MKQFEAPKKSLGDLDAEAAALLIAASTDVALVIDSEGVIQDVSFGKEELSLEGHGNWLGQRWADTVTVESRPKVEALLRDAGSKSLRGWRQVNYPSPTGLDLPVLHATMRVGGKGRVVAIGRDLRATAALQQRLVRAQQSMERDYSRLRHVETRYRLLFQMTSEAVLVVDSATEKIVEANPAAGQLLGETLTKVLGQPFSKAFAAESIQAMQSLLAGVRATARAETAQARLADSGKQLVVSASLFRQEKSPLYLIRLAPLDATQGASAMPQSKSKLLEVVESVPDGFVVTRMDGRILVANTAFLDMAQLATETQVRDESLGRWLGRPGVDLNVLLANLRDYGSVRLFATTLRGEYGASVEVEISAVSVPNGEHPCLGFTIRNVGRRLTADARPGRQLPRSVEQLTDLIGRVSLKELVRETTDVIERLCIEAALELTNDNRASAAEMLGVSRQSLYVKLRRYGLADQDSDTGQEQ